MLVVEIVLVVVVLLLLVLVLGGRRAQRRRLESDAGAFTASLESLDHELAAARAADRGWERSTLEAAARDLYRSQRPQTPAFDLTLVRILDAPGTDDDKAVFDVTPPAGAAEQLTLGRQDGAWVLDALT